MFSEEDTKRAKPVEPLEDMTQVQLHPQEVSEGRLTAFAPALALVSVIFLTMPKGFTADTIRWVVDVAAKLSPQKQSPNTPSVSTGDINVRANNSNVQVTVSSSPK